MNGSPARREDVESLFADYRAGLVAAGMFAGHPVTSVARTFFARVGVQGWEEMPLAAQCAVAAEATTRGRVADRDRADTAKPGLPGRLPALPR